MSSSKIGESVKREYQLLMKSRLEEIEKAGELEETIDHFLKVTASYGDGLFHCYSVKGLPRTNNE